MSENTPFEIERKFLIEMPERAILEDKSFVKYEILQTYLFSTDGELRVRRRKNGDNTEFFKTCKKRISAVKRIEKEEKISETEYLKMLENIEIIGNPISKTRYCIEYENHIFEIDVYPFMRDGAIAEIELESEDEDFIFPDFLKIIKEVTGDKEYKNSNLSLQSKAD